MTCDLVRALNLRCAWFVHPNSLAQERPCTRCIKRNIGHLCHDQPREADTQKGKNGKGTEEQSDTGSVAMPATMGPPSNFPAANAIMASANNLNLVQPSMQGTGVNNGSGNSNQCMYAYTSCRLTLLTRVCLLQLLASRTPG